MISKRFTLRTALVAIAFIALACYFAPTLYRRVKFYDHYQALSENNWRRTNGTADGYEFRSANGVVLSAWSTEHAFVEKSGLVEPKSFTPDPDRYYVVPPGKWVDSVDEVLETWDRYD